MDKHNRKYNTNTGLENFILRLKENNQSISYYYGYINSESKVKLKCNKCGNIFERYASCVRKNKKIRCYKCEKMATKTRKEQEKINRFKQKKKEKEAIKLSKEIDRLSRSKQLIIKQCKQCDSFFITDNPSKIYCNHECCKRYHNTQHGNTRKRYKKANGKVDYTITLDKLIKRDKNICHICGQECNLEDYTYQNNTFIAGNYYPSIDHIVPLSKGGTHSWNNVMLAHRICNSIKSDKLKPLER